MYKPMLRSGVILAFMIALAAPVVAQAPSGMPPKQVGVIEATLEDVPRILTLPGRAASTIPSIRRMLPQPQHRYPAPRRK